MIPAFNEAARIISCLDSVLASPLPPGCRWLLWSVLDDFSTDGTRELVEAWGREGGRPPIEVVRNGTGRQSKAGKLRAFHTRLVRDGFLDDVVVGIDADSTVGVGSLTALLEPLAEEPELAVVWGVGHPDDCSFGHWASAFQMELVTGLVRRNPNSPRGFGRLFAYRVRGLAEFNWNAQEISDDCQVGRFARSRALNVISSLDACVYATPAGSYRDFYLQTYRAYAAFAQGTTPPVESRTRIGTFASLATSRPHWALAYLLARGVVGVRHRVRPVSFSAIWQTPSTTKLSGDHPRASSQ